MPPPPGLRIGKPAVLAEGENINAAAVQAYMNRRAAMPVAPVLEEEEEVWEVPLNLFGKNAISVGNANNRSPNLTLFNKPPSTPKAQMIKPKNKPPKIKRNRKTRKTRKGRKSRKQNRK
jgi:hypothetical protein